MEGSNKQSRETMKLDARTEQVVEMYSKYPFPFGGSDNVDSYFQRYVLPTFRRLHQEKPIQRLLEAGCGTGNITAEIATALPEMAITAVDLTPESLAHARQRAERRGLRNLTFQQSNLMEHDPALGQFDFIYSQGVIHHLTDPLAGMRNLNRYLHPGRYAYVWLYSLLGRQRVLEMREALRILGVDALPWEQKIQLALAARPYFLSQPLTLPRKLIKVLEYVDERGWKGLLPYLYGHLRRKPPAPGALSYEAVHIADYILHPQDKYYRFGEALDLFHASGFELIGVLQGMSNSLAESLGADNQLIQGRQFSQREAYTLIELHEQPEGVGFLIRKTTEA